MAESLWGVNDAVAVKHWSKDLNRAAPKTSFVYTRFVGKGPNNIVELRDETKKMPGDRIRLQLRAKPTQDGVLGDATLEGNEEGMTVYTDDIQIDQLRFGFKEGGRVSRQRVPWSARAEMRDMHSLLWGERWDECFFNQAAGYTPQGVLQRTGNVAIRAATANRIYRADAVADDESLTSSNRIDVDDIDRVVTKLKLADPKIRPIVIDGNAYWVCILHPGQTEDLRDSAGKLWETWRSAISGGHVTDNPIYTGALGSYNGVIFHESEFIPQGITNAGAAQANTRRAVFLGAQAATLATGRAEFGLPSAFEWIEKTFDYGNKLGVASGCVFALQKNQYNSEDFATYVLTTYSDE